MAAAAAKMTAATMVVLGPPKVLSSGTKSRQPPAAPARSKKYTRFTRSMVSETASDTMAPETKNGKADVK
jgi:hypothetical protein